MKVRSVSDCLNLIDDSLVENIIGISILENIHKNLLELEQSDFIEAWVALSNVLRQINSLIENYYKFGEEDFKK